MENEITSHVKSVAEEYAVHPALAAEFADTVQSETRAEQPEEQIVEQAVARPIEAKSTTESVQAKNFRQLREKAERAERERDELIKLLQQKQQTTEEPELSIGESEIVEGKHLSRYDKRMAKMQHELEQTKAQVANSAVRLKLNSEYPDFHKVVTPDNIAKLEMEYPELAATLNSSKDLYSTGVSTYTLLKKFNIAVEDNYESDRYKVQQNTMKPKPVIAASSQQGASPLAKANAFANGLTDELRKQLIKEMAEARKGL